MPPHVLATSLSLSLFLPWLRVSNSCSNTSALRTCRPSYHRWYEANEQLSCLAGRSAPCRKLQLTLPMPAGTPADSVLVSVWALCYLTNSVTHTALPAHGTATLNQFDICWLPKKPPCSPVSASTTRRTHLCCCHNVRCMHIDLRFARG